MPDASHPKRYGMRDFAAEQQALARLMRGGFTGPDDQGRYQLLGQERVLNFVPMLARSGEALLTEMRLGAAEHARSLMAAAGKK